jgi:hypothetical protein
MNKPDTISDEAWIVATERRAAADRSYNDPATPAYFKRTNAIVMTWDDCIGMARLYDLMLADCS